MGDQVTVNELEELPDGTLRVGNSREVPWDEAVALVEQKKAKFPEHPIGVVPDDEDEEHRA